MAKFTGTVYKIYHKVENKNDFMDIKTDDITLGLTNSEGLSKQLISKLNKGIKCMGAPWKTCIPLYRNSFFVFYCKSALQTFLFKLCELTDTDLIDLHNAGYLLYELEVDGITAGYSEMRGTVDLDEVEKYTEIEFNSLSKVYTPVNDVTPDKESINYTKTTYYNKFKLNF